MDDSAFSDEFCAFLQTTVPTVDAAELLLALKSEPDRQWSPRDAAQSLQGRVNFKDGDAVRYLELFVSRSLLMAHPERRYQYRPASPELAGFVETLAKAYNERPVTLIRMIYALRDEKIRSFADAFKIRRR
jgi:hypothetical protein